MEVLTALLQSDDFVRGVFYIIAAIGAAIVVWVAAQVRGDARLAKWANAIKIARDFAMNLMLTIRTEGLDMGAVVVNGKVIDYNELALTSEERLGRKFDARFLYVADSVEIFIYEKFGLKFEFDKFWPMYEGWYQTLRRSPNGITMNDNDIVTAANGQSAVLEVTVDTEREARRLAQQERRRREREQREAQAEPAAIVPVE